MPEPDVIEPPRPAPDALTEPFWEALRSGQLTILRCDACGQYIHYPRPVCRFCRSTELSWAPVSGRGRVYSYTVTVQPFHPYWEDKAPYIVATIELDEQPHLQFVSNIVDCDEDDVAVGMRVEVEFREVAPDLTLPLFRKAAA